MGRGRRRHGPARARASQPPGGARGPDRPAAPAPYPLLSSGPSKGCEHDRHDERASRPMVVARRPRGLLGVRPAPLPPDPPLRIDARHAGPAGRGQPGARPAGRRDAAAARPGAVPLLVHPQGGGALVADRGHAVLAVRPAAVRERGRAGRAARRCRGDLELHRGDEPRAAADRVRRAAAQQPAAARGPRAPDGRRARRRQGAGRVPAQPELARRDAAGQRPLRPAAAARGRAGA